MKLPITILVCLLTLAACATDPGRQTTGVPSDTRARALLAEGDYQAAAAEYLRLADREPGNAVLYRLRAADAYLEAGLIETAAELLTETGTTTDPDPKTALDRQLLQAKLALYRAEPEQTLALLDPSLPDFAEAASHRRYHRLRALALEQLQQPQAAILERLTLQPYLEIETAREENTHRLWNSFTGLDEASLQELTEGAGQELTGWIALTSINRQLWSSPAELESAIDSWSRGYPEHPARPVITGQLLAFSREMQLQPDPIALLLPLSGPYQRASEAIREGFMSAWYQSDGYQPLIRLYNTDAQAIEKAYQQAVDDGAELIVGPLQKSAIRVLAAGSMNTTTLALNRIDDSFPESGSGSEEPLPGLASAPMYQFALAPEDEVHQIARRGLSDGLSRALVISPDSEWGRRMIESFTASWGGQPGKVLETVTYNPGTQDFISPVKQLLNLDSSEARIRQLRQLLSRNIVSDSRTRKDAELIYMAAIPVAARQIVPQFRFFRVGNLPIYSNSHAYSGTPEPRVDADMNGVEFTDIPWILRKPAERPPIQQAMAENWSSETSPYRRLYAFGVDAFQVISHLKRMSYQQDYHYQGHSGNLFMHDDGRIQRYLQWARFVNGVPLPMDIGYGFEDEPAVSSSR